MYSCAYQTGSNVIAARGPPSTASHSQNSAVVPAERRGILEQCDLISRNLLPVSAHFLVMLEGFPFRNSEIQRKEEERNDI